jgi:transposase InsO family protein
MTLNLHANATTTPKTRASIQSSTAGNRTLARELGVTLSTIHRWRRRADVHDASHTPHRLQTTLTSAQELVVVELRRTLWLSLDDLLVVAHEFVNPAVSRSGLDRCLRRHGVASLTDLLPKVDGKAAPKKTFKDYAPGFLHAASKYLPQMPDEDSRRYLFVAIDRATRWVFLRIYADQSERSRTDFLRRLHKAAPMKIIKLLTDNGSQFTDRFTSQRKTPSGTHAFDLACQTLGIEHRLIPPRHPQTNGMVERFNGRISEVLATTRFVSGEELATTINRYTMLYNHHIPQKALGHKTPLDAMREWDKKEPDLFVRRIRNHTGPDM